MSEPIRRHPYALFVTFLTSLVVALLGAPAGHAAGTCTLYASPAGSDAANGSISTPFATPQKLADSLEPGQVGCFLPGTYVTSTSGGVEVSRPGITLTSAPGTRATLVGRLWISRGADGVTISELNLNGRNPGGEPGPVVNAVGTRFLDDDVTNEHTAICFILGSFEYGAALGTVIEGSRIHDCGVMAPQNHDHGIYVENATGAIIRDNWIYDNADRGIQLYPQAVNTLVTENVIYGNGQGVIFSSSSLGVSTGNRVERNVIANSRIRWNLESFWEGPVGSGNVARSNCLWGANQDQYYNQGGGVLPQSQGAAGFTAEDNFVAAPEFVDAAAGDFTLAPGSACAFIRAGGRPAGASPPAPGGATPRVTLRKHQSAVRRSAPLVLSGKVDLDAARTVEIVRWKDGGWHSFARRHVRADGTFVVRKRLRGAPGAQRLKATVGGSVSSRPVKVRLLPLRRS